MAYTHESSEDREQQEWDIDHDQDDDFEDDEERCHTCGGEGWVLSVVEETNRYGWDKDEPGECPNCGGSGLMKDCTTF